MNTKKVIQYFATVAALGDAASKEPEAPGKQSKVNELCSGLECHILCSQITKK